MLGVHLSTFIPIVISFVAVGALFYYFNNRITVLEKSLIRQNQVLADFIANVRKQVQQPDNSDNKVSDSKIAVSDDENEEHLEIEDSDEDTEDDTEDSDTDDDIEDSDTDEESEDNEEEQREEQREEQQEEQEQKEEQEQQEEQEHEEEEHEDEEHEEEHEEDEQQDDEEESSSDDSSSDDSNHEEDNVNDVATQLQDTTDANDTQENTSDFLVDETHDNTDVNGDLLSDNIEDEVEPVSQEPQQVEVEDISNHSTEKLDSVLDVNVNSNMTLSNITDEMLETLGTDTTLDNSLSTIHHENNSVSEINTNELNRYKLDQLKTLAIQLGIPNQENIRKMKKQEIINAIKSFRA